MRVEGAPGEPTLTVHADAPDPRAVVLVIPGGKVASTRPAHPWHLAHVRMALVARRLVSDHPGLAVYRVRYRVRGWNDPRRDPVRDAQWALDTLATRHRGVPVILVGHSMGGRVTAHLADRDDVTAVVALAPWWPEHDTDRIPPGRRLLAVHGHRDRWTDPAVSRRETDRCRDRGVDATWIEVPGGHFMASAARQWRRHTRAFVDDVLHSLGAPQRGTP